MKAANNGLSNEELDNFLGIKNDKKETNSKSAKNGRPRNPSADESGSARGDDSHASLDSDGAPKKKKYTERLGCWGRCQRSTKFNVHKKEKSYDHRSLGILPGDWKLRKMLVWLIEWPWFDRFITLTILANSMLLAATDYEGRFFPEGEYVSPREKPMRNVDLIFSAIFFAECVSKVLAMGFWINKNAYLRDVWNWLDFFVVIISVIDWFPSSGGGNSSLKSLRTFRILRPLRSINAMPRMRQLIQSLLKSLPGLINVIAFLGFAFSIFAIFGVH